MTDAEPRSDTALFLMQAAVELIAERGYAGTSVDALCRRAGIVKSGLYWNFGSKDGLLSAVLEAVGDEWVAAIRSACQGDDAPIDWLERALGGLRHRIDEHWRAQRVLLVVLLERGAVDAETRATLSRFFASARTEIASTLTQQLEPLLDPNDAEAIADLMLAMGEGIFLHSLLGPDSATLERLLSAMRDSVALLVRSRLRQPAVPVTIPAPPLSSGKAGAPASQKG